MDSLLTTLSLLKNKANKGVFKTKSREERVMNEKK